MVVVEHGPGKHERHMAPNGRLESRSGDAMVLADTGVVVMGIFGNGD